MVFSRKEVLQISAKFLLGASAVIEKVGLLPYFSFLARTVNYRNLY